jgi:murein DD-endopeptidase MepM/ murein hydrolase activator NlpD
MASVRIRSAMLLVGTLAILPLTLPLGLIGRSPIPVRLGPAFQGTVPAADAAEHALFRSPGSQDADLGNAVSADAVAGNGFLRLRVGDPSALEAPRPEGAPPGGLSGSLHLPWGGLTFPFLHTPLIQSGNQDAVLGSETPGPGAGAGGGGAGPTALGPERTAPGSETAAPTSHTVVWGDSLWQIAQTAGVSVASLAATNHICEDAILRLGRVLILPPAGSSAPDASSWRSSCRISSGVHETLPRREVFTSSEASDSAEHPIVGSRRNMLWPSDGRITSRFGWRIHPIFGTREFHTGVDIGTPWGAPVVAARSGIIRFVGWKAGYGRLIVVDHGNGLETDYSHLSAALVQTGQHVVEGQIIGRVGNTGWSTGPHLFFEIRKNGIPLDPFRYLH